MEKKTIMISLLGGRPVPNVQAALHLRPSQVYFVASRDSVKPGGNYQKAVQALPDSMKPEQPLRAVDPYSMRETQDACAALADQHPDDDIVLVLASEPKMMALGGYEFARATPRVRLCNVVPGRLIWLPEGKVEPMTLDLKDYFAIYGWSVDWTAAHMDESTLPQKWNNLLDVIGEHLEAACELFAHMRVAAQQVKSEFPRQHFCARCLSETESAILEVVHQNGLLNDLTFNQSGIQWKSVTGSDLKSAVLTGDWLEAYVFREALRSGAFQACAWNVQDTTLHKSNVSQDTRQLDFVGIRNGQLVAASCKTNLKLTREFFEEIRARADQLGKGMCSPMLIGAARRDSGTELERWAAETEVTLVTRADLPQIRAILSKIMDGKPDAHPKHITIYPRV